MEQATTDGLGQQEAFDALVEASAELLREGRVARAAAVKSALQRRLGTFDEAKLGFPSFRAFLIAAQDAGRVQIRPAAVGPDVDVVPIGVELPTPPSSTHTNRLRRDVWDAFTRWDDGFIRFWNRSQSRAFRISERPFEGEAVEVSAMRDAYIAKDPQIVPIAHVSVEDIVGWARDFILSLPNDPSRVALLGALEQELPVHNFTQLVRRLGFGPRWHDWQAGRVRSLVEQWAADHAIEVDLSREPDALDRRADQTRSSRSTAGPSTDADLRRRVHELVDQMTVPELLNIAVPLRLMVQDW